MKVCYRKEGRVCTIFLDNGKPLPFTDFDNVPEIAFPQLMAEAEIKQRFGGPGVEFVAIERPREPQPIAAPVSDEAVERMFASLKKGEPVDKVSSTVTVSPTIQHGTLQVVPPGMHSKIQTELTLLFARYEEATGKRKLSLKVELEAVCRFVLALDPQYKELLNELKMKLEEPKFSL